MPTAQASRTLEFSDTGAEVVLQLGTDPDFNRRSSPPARGMGVGWGERNCVHHSYDLRDLLLHMSVSALKSFMDLSGILHLWDSPTPHLKSQENHVKFVVYSVT